MALTVCTLGELLVEFLASEENQGFIRPGDFHGPYPSGAPAIFADQIARQGLNSILFSCVGNDVFGDLNLSRLSRDGVNTRGITVLPGQTTGSAFVSYRNQNDRDFVFNMPNSACGQLSAEHIDKRLLEQCQHFHIMGSSLFSFNIIDAVRKVIENVKQRGGSVSFDPNIRKELLDIPEVTQAFEYILDYTDIFLPSEGELQYFGRGSQGDESPLINQFLTRGIQHVVVKRGPKGASYYNQRYQYHIGGIITPVIDPTGAGDCFAATFISQHLLGKPVEQALKWANASGCLAIRQRGPMEGTSSPEQVRDFLSEQGLSDS